MAQLTIQQAFDLALQHHQAGQLQEAERLYRQILAQQPQHPNAMHNLGVIAHQMGRNDLAMDLIRRALTLNPNHAEAHGNLGIMLRNRGLLDEAIAAFRQATALNPSHAEAYSNLGNVLQDKGQLDEAIAVYRQAVALGRNDADLHYNLGNVLKDTGQRDQAITAYRQAISLKPDLADAHLKLGNALKEDGQVDQAIAAYRQAIRFKPDFVESHNNLGVLLEIAGRPDEAIASYRQAIRLKPDFVEAYYNLGNALTAKGQLDEAIASCRQAIRLKPDLAEAHYNLGNALKSKAHYEDAIAAYSQAIRLKPDYVEAHSNLGVALREVGQLDEAIAAYGQAIRIKPDLAEAHNNLSLALLTRGDFQRGWEEYEWRWKCKDFTSPAANFAQPQWDGGPLEARTILLRTEQGFGDALQIIRYLPLVAQRGASGIIIECQGELQRLLGTSAGNCQILARGQPLPGFDLHCSLLSLPRIFGTNLTNIPNEVPYLHADAEDAGRWQRRLAERPPRINVGLVWAGRPTHINDHNRSMKLAKLAPLGQAPGVRFFSLQKGEAAAEAKTPPAGMELTDWTEELKDFADTAALIANLDLVIAVDTAVVHLAGAMGKPVWTLLPYVPDWRWLLQRQDSPWYPSMRLFRHPSRGDWDSVITRVAEALSLWIKNRD